MSVAATGSALEVRSISAALRAGWFELRQSELAAWNDVLRRTDAPIYQYPFWNEPYRRLWITPRYLAWGTEYRPLAFASILTVGVGPVKIGLVFRGPVTLSPGIRLSRTMCEELFDWASRDGYMFLRFTHSDPEVLTDLATAGYAIDADAFPYMADYPIVSEDYVVQLHESENETLASFDREARRKIRRGAESGYEFHADDSPEALKRTWSLYQNCARLKHFRLERPLSFYLEMMHGATGNLARTYTVSYQGKTVGSTLVFRDSTTAHCLLAGFDAGHRNSAAFLHWRSMRDMYRLGAVKYNMGPGPGSLARFKSEFCPYPVHYPGPLTIILKKNRFALWKLGVIPAAKQLRPMLRRVAFQTAALMGSR